MMYTKKTFFCTHTHHVFRKNRQIKGANYFQIGTVRSNGRPANRTVVRLYLAQSAYLAILCV